MSSWTLDFGLLRLWTLDFLGLWTLDFLGLWTFIIVVAMNHLARARSVFDIELAALRSVRRRLDDAFDRAVELIVDTLGRRG